jgi:DNA-binding beta-propeller fold protein YncE
MYKFRIYIVFYLLSMFLCTYATNLPAEASDDKKYLWPPPPATAKIQWIGQWADRNDFGKTGKVLEFLVGKERIEKLQRPNGVVVDQDGTVFVADSEMKLIFVFDVKKNTLRFLGLQRLAAPIGLAIDNKRNIVFVSDGRNKKIFGIDKNSDDVVMTFGGPNEFKNPTGIVYDEERERLYVSDTQSHNIKVFDKNGKHLFTIGHKGINDGEFNFPSYLALDKTGKLFVVDSFNFRIQIFNHEGKFLKKFGKIGDGSGSFTRPHGIGVDSDGNIYVIDAAFNNFQVFNETGRLQLWIGNAGNKPGEFFLPSGMYVDKYDRIYISDTFNRRVQVFQYLKEKPASP